MISQIRGRKLPLAPLSFLLLAAIWGTSFVAIEVGLQTVPPLLFAALRYDLAGLVVLAYALASGRRLIPSGRAEWTAVGLGAGLLIGGHHALLYLGQQYVSGAVASILIALVPILTVVAAAASQEGGLEPVQYPGVLLGFLGVVAIVAPDGSGSAGVSLLGVGLLVLSAAVFAGGTVAFNAVRNDLPPASLLAWVMLGGAGLLHLASFASGEPVALAFSPAVAGSLAYLSLGSSVLAYVLYFDLLDRVGSVELNLVNYVQPIAATLVSWLVTGAVVGTTTLFGFGVVFTGFALLKRNELAGSVRSLRVTISQIARWRRDDPRPVSKWF